MDRSTSAGGHNRSRRLRLVASSDRAASDGGSDADNARSRPRDWSRLMMRAQDGDRRAYRSLLQEVTPYLRALAARCFKAPDDIEDAVQDVLLAVHAVRHAYDPGRPFGPWLVAIAARSREIAFTTEHETFSTVQANLRSSLESTSADEAALHEAIAKLAPDQRQAIRLLKLKEMSLKEAAQASGRSVTALKVATHRAITRLRKMLLMPSKSP
jgi:RNA polymerase sigma-70 factor, ECF subfamily